MGKLLAGGAAPGLFTKRDEGEEYDGDLIAGCMTAGMWGGLALGIVLTGDQPPDPNFGKKATKPAGPSTTVSPWSSGRGQMGLMASGSW